MIRRALLPLLLGLTLFSTGCPIIGVVADSISSAAAADPPRVTASWAGKARGIMSPATPADDELEPIAEYGPPEDRDTNELDDLDEDEGLVQVHVKMGPGTYYLEDQVILLDADVVIEGEAPHKTRLYLANDERKSIYIKRAKSVVLKNMTVIGYTGGGIFMTDCEKVEVDNAHFAGIDRAIALRGSKATVTRSIFDGCAVGVYMDGAELNLSETVFQRCYEGIGGEGKVELTSNAFVANRKAITANLTRRSVIKSNLFFGAKQEAAWNGRPRTVTGNLTHRRDLGKLFPDDQTNYAIKDDGNFPEGVRLPPGFDVAGVHLALARQGARGSKDPSAPLNDVAFDGATRYADAATRAAKNGDLASARAAIKVAMRYWGDRPLEEAPDQLVALAGLLDEPKPIK